MKESLLLYRGRTHTCSYLPGKQATTLIVDPSAPMNNRIYGYLLEQGFRRSGGHIYRPHCEACQACVPLRLPVESFSPNRSQRRIRAKSRSAIEIIPRPAGFREEHFDLYCRYMQSRHPDGEMADTSPDQYLDFLTSAWSETRFIELHLSGKLMAVAVTDLIPNGLSAVYTFFEPELSHLSPGVLAVLYQIEQAQQEGRSWLYLGYWIPNCRKMKYKDQYRPLQLFIQGEWQEFKRGEEIEIKLFA